jgi:pimeloyl-ACP methyl ester carboxylesterase
MAVVSPSFPSRGPAEAVPCAYQLTDARGERGSDGPLVVLIHGVGLDRSMWREHVEVLARQAPVLAYDLRGHGASPVHPVVSSLDDYVADLHWLLTERIETGPVDLVGFSLGGLIAQAFAIAHPQLVHRIVLSNTFARSEADRNHVMRRFEDVRNASGGSDSDSLARWFTPEFLADNASRLTWISERLAANDREAYLAAHELTVIGDQHLADGLADIGHPTLVVTAEGDIGASPEMAHRLTGLLPNASCVILPGRHLCMLECPAEYVATLTSFLYAEPSGAGTETRALVGSVVEDPSGADAGRAQQPQATIE